MSAEHAHEQGNSTLTYFDSYCERAGEIGLWAEPLNAITNIAFLLAAYHCYKLWRDWDGFRWRTGRSCSLDDCNHTRAA